MTVRLHELGEYADQFAVGDLMAAASVLCRLNVENQCDPAPCARHLSTAHYMLAAVAHEQVNVNHAERPVKAPWTDDHHEVIGWDKERAVINIGNRTWWELVPRDKNEPKWSRWRVFWHRYWRTDYGCRRPAGPNTGTLVSSLCDDGWHMPALDIDFTTTLVPSTTGGHYHLYLNKRMRWWRYRILLRALKFAGIIEPGYYKASIRRRSTYLWRPGLYKQNIETS
jgi:hypothetical protein